MMHFLAFKKRIWVILMDLTQRGHNVSGQPRNSQTPVSLGLKQSYNGVLASLKLFYDSFIFCMYLFL